MTLHDPVVIPKHRRPIDLPSSCCTRTTRRPASARDREQLVGQSPRKGSGIPAWLDRNLDFDTFELTFAGRTQQRFERIRIVEPLPSEALAELLRAQDVYLAPSRDDPCSNALLEALACGLPAAYLRSGGHPELVGEGGIGFDDG